MENKTIKYENKVTKKEDFENKENNANFSIFDCNDSNSFIFLHKKRKAFEYTCESEKNYNDKENNEDNKKEKDYFVNLKVNGSKRLIGNQDVFFN